MPLVPAATGVFFLSLFIFLCQHSDIIYALSGGDPGASFFFPSLSLCFLCQYGDIIPLVLRGRPLSPLFPFCVNILTSYVSLLSFGILFFLLFLCQHVGTIYALPAREEAPQDPLPFLFPYYYVNMVPSYVPLSLLFLCQHCVIIWAFSSLFSYFFFLLFLCHHADTIQSLYGTGAKAPPFSFPSPFPSFYVNMLSSSAALLRSSSLFPSSFSFFSPFFGRYSGILLFSDNLSLIFCSHLALLLPISFMALLWVLYCLLLLSFAGGTGPLTHREHRDTAPDQGG